MPKNRKWSIKKAPRDAVKAKQNGPRDKLSLKIRWSMIVLNRETSSSTQGMRAFATFAESFDEVKKQVTYLQERAMKLI
uniref:Uncharacterized protein n=1 Tax=Strigamia maritima TaxID=126957 RepID=T1ILN9_STRMM